MGQKAITIYTPESTAAHISAEDDAFIYRSLLGAESGVLGSLVCTKVDDNTVSLSGGGVCNRGYILWIPDGETLELSIDNGEAGMCRIDTVAAVFTKGGGDTADTHVFTIVKGTAAATDAVPNVPLSFASLSSPGDYCSVPLFYVTLIGTSIRGITNVNLPPVGRSITHGTSAPSGGRDGDIYFKIES